MKRILFLLTFACTALFSACEYDDSEVWSTLNDYGNRISKLEALCAQMNTNITSLQTIVNALQQKDFITTVAPITQNGKEIGYSITFSSGKSITIYHGNDGKDGADGSDGSDGKDGTDGTDGSDGYTPKIGVKKDADGIYYWTIDGEWLTDDDGNKIQAQGKDGLNGGKDGEDGEDGKDGTDGADGKDGITPQLKIEEDYWYVSYDNGTTWTKLGKAKGEDGKDGTDGKDGQDGKDGVDGEDGKDGYSGDNVFQSVTQDANNVYFVLSDGTTITIPKAASAENIELTYIPRYSDGKATVFYATKEDSYVELDFEVSPVSAAQQIASNWQSWATVKAVYTETRAAVSLIDMPIISCTADSQAGIITVKASGKNLSDDFFAGADDASARLSITVDNAKYTSDYVPMVAKETVKLTEYVLTTIFKTSQDNKEIYIYGGTIAGDSNPLINIDYGDGSFGTTRKHTYSKAGEYSVKFYFSNPLTMIADYAFGDTPNLYSIIIPNTVKEIGKYAFSSYLNTNLMLNTVTFEEGSLLENIGDAAFAHTAIESIRIPSTVKSIGEFAFTNCNKLTDIYIYNHQDFINYSSGTIAQKLPNDVEVYVAFAGGQQDLTFLGIGNTVDEINSGVYSFCPYIKIIDFTYAFSLQKMGQVGMNCANLESIEGLDRTGVNKISENSFSRCPKLTAITIPANIKTLENCFSFNDSLTDVTLTEGVMTLASVFNHCPIKTIIIPSSITSINDSFNDNSTLTSIYCKATTPPTLSDSFNAITDSAKIYVPVGSGAAYKAADGWKDYASMIEEKEM